MNDHRSDWTMTRRTLLKSSAAGALVIAGGSLLAGCGEDDSGSDGATAETIALTQFLSTPGPSFINAVDAVAVEMGFYADEGIELSTDYPGNSIRGIQTLIGGSGDMSQADSFAVLVAGGEGLDLRSVYLSARGYVFGMVVRADSPITEWNVDSVAGKRLGITEFGGGEVPVLRGAVARLGLTEGGDGGVELVPIGAGGAETADAIESGAVDIIAASVLDFEIFRASGLDLRTITPDYVLNFPGQSVVTTPEHLEANRSGLVRALRARAKATVFMQYNVMEAAEVAIAAAPASAEGIPAELVAALLSSTGVEGNAHAFEEGNPDFHRIGAQDTTAYDDFQNFLIETGIEDEDGTTISELIDLGPIIDNSLIDEINDFDYDEIQALAEQS